jgi:hypothetical protein
MLLMARHEGQPLEEIYWSFTYQVRRDAQGIIDGVRVVAYDITEQVRTHDAVAASARQARELARQLSATNQQLTRVNVDLDTAIYTASHDLKVPSPTSGPGADATQRAARPRAWQRGAVHSGSHAGLGGALCPHHRAPHRRERAAQGLQRAQLSRAAGPHHRRRAPRPGPAAARHRRPPHGGRAGRSYGHVLREKPTLGGLQPAQQRAQAPPLPTACPPCSCVPGPRAPTWCSKCRTTAWAST